MNARGRELIISSGVEYALYGVAVMYPDLFDQAESFVGTGGMLANDQPAARRVKAMLEKEYPSD